MSLKPETVQKVASLARLSLDDAELDTVTEKLAGIIDFVGQLDSADTASTSPLAHPLDIDQRLRPDEVTEENQRDLFQQNAPDVEDGHYLVPRVIE